MIELLRTNSSHSDFKQLVLKLDQELWERYPTNQAKYAPHNRIIDNATVIVAYRNSQPVGCGCFKAQDENTIEIKRMYVAADQRNQGIAAAVLAELEAWATELSFTHAVLETGTGQPEAIRLYQKSGYTIIENYGPYIEMDTSVCMAKEL